MARFRALVSIAMCLFGAIEVTGCDTPPPAGDAAVVGDAAMGDGGVPGADTGVPPTDTGVPPTDAGMVMATSIRYVPEGCTDMVSTPTVIDAQRSSDVFGASPTFDHVHIGYAGPTDSTVAVIWRSDEGTYASSVLIGTDRAAVLAADDTTAGVARHAGHTLLYSSAASGAGAERIHEVHVCGLTAGTTYYYRVGGPGHWSDAFDFTTGPSLGSADPWSFGVTGDSRGASLSGGPGDNAWAIAQHHLADRGAELEVFTGDAVFLGSNQDLWNTFFEGTDGAFAVQDYLAGHALMMSNGNHDLLTVNYLAQFAMPQEASPGELDDGEEWYSFDYANAHFIILNDTVTSAGTIAGAEADWLEADLSAVDRALTPWIFVVHHQALFTCGSTHGPATNARNAWQPIFDAHHVDFVLAGHNHVYERTQPIFGVDGANGHVAPHGGMGEPTISGGTPSGTIYLVAGGAGAPLYGIDTSACPATRVGMSIRNYVTFEIDDRTLHMTTRNSLSDAVVDEVTYTK